MKLKVLIIFLCILIMPSCLIRDEATLILNDKFIVSHGVSKYEKGKAYDICFNKPPKSVKELDPEFVALIKNIKSDVDEALSKDCVGVFLNVPSTHYEHGIFWGYFTKEDWNKYNHNLMSYVQNISFLSGVSEINDRKLNHTVLPFE